MIDNDTLPVMDDGQNQGPSEQDLLDAVLANSPIMDEVGVPLPEEEESVPDPEESVVDEDPTTEEAVSEEEEEVEEEEEEVEGEDAVEETATDEPEVYTSDDLDLDAKVMVKVDGNEMEVSFGDLIKGYQTDAHLSKQGRELGEARKALEAERDEKLKEVDDLASASVAMLTRSEQYFSNQYHEIDKEIDKARKDGDTYQVNELKDQREQIQKNYWGARREREGLMEAVKKQQQEATEKAWQEQIDHFTNEIPNLIPDFDEKVAEEIRQFAIDKGINTEVLDQITDPVIVKFVDDYRRLEQQVSKGAAKRKVVKTQKAVPTKKAKPAAKKQAQKEDTIRAKALSENSTPEDQMAFLRQHASRTLNL